MERGLADIEEAISVSRAQGHRPAVGHCLCVAGGLLLAAGDDDAAAARFDESLAIHLETGDHWGIARVLEGMALLAGRRERPRRAVVFHVAAQRIRDGIGMPRAAIEGKLAEACMAECRDRLAPDDFERACEQGSESRAGGACCAGA